MDMETTKQEKPIPAGYVLVTEGCVQEGDKIWNRGSKQWQNVTEELISYYDSVNLYFGVIRMENKK